MARSVYSAAFIKKQGLTGHSGAVTVPPGHVYVVKQATAYGNTTFQWSAVLHSLTTGETRWAAGANGLAAAWFGFYGALVFEPGDQFEMQAFISGLDSIDVYAGGYDLLLP